ncbi:MAG: FAD:protein FMN transferase [bacterium]
MTQFVFEAIGTHWIIDIYQPLSIEKEAEVISGIKENISDFEKTFSRFRTDSIVHAISQNAGEYVFPLYAQKLLDIYKTLYEKTDGFFTPLIGSALVSAGYDKEYSLQQKEVLQKTLLWEDVLSYEYPILQTSIPIQLDFGAAGKGYLIDLVGEVLQSFGIQYFCIDAGGDILYKNTTPLAIGLENPEDTTQVLGVYQLQNKSIAGSSGARRAWGDFTHIINPKTLVSPREIIAVWVVADTAIVADALTTCLFFVEPHTLMDSFKFEYLVVYKDFSIKKSANFSADLF